MLIQMKVRFGDRRTKFEVMSDLGRRKYQAGAHPVQHLERLLAELQQTKYQWTEEDKFEVLRDSLPESLRNNVILQNYTTVQQIFDMCHKLFPSTPKGLTPMSSTPYRGNQRNVNETTEGIEPTEPVETEDLEVDVVRQAVHRLEKAMLKSKPPPRFQKLPDGTFALPEEFLTAQMGNENLICSNCRMYGHGQKSCPAQTRRLHCFRCGKPGITSTQCPVCITTKSPSGEEKPGSEKAKVATQ